MKAFLFLAAGSLSIALTARLELPSPAYEESVPHQCQTISMQQDYSDSKAPNLVVAANPPPPVSLNKVTPSTKAPLSTKGAPGANKNKIRQFGGNVSWYGAGFNGKKTASGEIFNMNKLMAAHPSLPFGTRVQIEDPKTGASVVVVVTDRGPYVRTRVMDVSREAGRRLGLLLHGVGYMYCLVLDD